MAEVTAKKDFDVDDPPEREPWAFHGKLIQSVYVDDADGADKIDPAIGENYRKYMDASARPHNTKVWILRAQGLDVAYDDGQPYIRTEIIPVVSKKGNWLTTGQTPDQVASRFRELGLTASPRSIDQPNSAVGKLFFFEETELTLGGGYVKRVTLFPTQLTPDFVAAEVRQITRGGSDASPEAPADASPEDVAAVVAALDGVSPANMLTTILGAAQLKTIPRVLGHDLIQSATDESLSALLVQAGLMQLVDGVLRVASAEEAPA